MAMPDSRSDADAQARMFGPARALASALVQVMGRGEPPPARWASRRFCEVVAYERSLLASAHGTDELDAVAGLLREPTFRGAATALAADPRAVALAVRRLELVRGGPLPPWPDIVRLLFVPRVADADRPWRSG